MEPEGHYSNNKAFLKIKYSWRDVRYTTKDEVIYATLLGWPGTGEEIHLKSFAADSLSGPLTIDSVSLLGSEESVDWKQTDSGLAITTPAQAPDEMAVVFKIRIKE